MADRVTIAANVPQGSTIGLTQPIIVAAPAGSTVSVSVIGDDGVSVPGTFDPSSGSWLPNDMLAKGRTYTVKATARTSAGSTMTGSRTLVSASTGAGTTGIYVVRPHTRSDVGNAQPVSITFSQAVPADQRAAVARRFTVKDTAGVEGAWRWLSPTRLDYRPKDKWPVGDRVSVSGSIHGMPIGSTYGAGTLEDTGFTVTSDLEAVYDPATRTFTVTKGGKVIRTMKSGGGKKGFESLTGKMVVLSKSESVRMRSCSVGISCTPGSPNYYDELINHAVQISESGTYLHAAPWDTQIGEADTSHGCFHLSAEDAKWFYDEVLPGNLVTIKGSSNPVSVTNGEGDWNLSWQEWIAPAS